MTETGTRRITYEGNPAYTRALMQMLEEEGVTVRWEGDPPTEHRDARGMAEAVIGTLLATGAIEGIKAGVQRFRARFGGATAKIEGEDDGGGDDPGQTAPPPAES